MVLPTSALPVKAIFRIAGWADQRRARAGTIAGDDVDHPGRDPDGLEVLGQLEDGERRLLRRLEHHGAPGRQCRSDLPGGHHERVVPGDDLPGHAHRLPHGKGHRVGRDREHLAVDLGGQTAVVLEAGGGVVHVVLGFGDRLAGVPGLQLGQLRPAGPYPLGQPEQNPAPVLGRDRFPAIVEGLGGGLGGEVDIGSVAGRDRRDGLLGGRIIHLERLPAS